MPTTLILGASRGIGLELARQYVFARQRVIATARSPAGLATLRELGAEALPLDVTDPAGMQGLARQLVGTKLDTAWYVAGVMCSRADARHAPDAAGFDRVMHTNVLGAMRAIAELAPLVEAAHGRFGFLTSTMGQIGTVGASNVWLYRTSKAALNMAVAAARHSHPQALFALFHPGWVRTDMGGPGANVRVSDCATRLRVTLASATAADNGAFFDQDGSRLAGW